MVVKFLHFTYEGKEISIDLRNRLVFANYAGSNFTMIINKITNYSELFSFITKIIGIKLTKPVKDEVLPVVDIVPKEEKKDEDVTENLIINNNDIEIKGSKRIMSNEKFNSEIKEYLEDVEVNYENLESGKTEDTK